ncbi:MAG: hypothetical protein ABF303_04245 [Desulfobacterales bacterium]
MALMYEHDRVDNPVHGLVIYLEGELPLQEIEAMVDDLDDPVSKKQFRG